MNVETPPSAGSRVLGATVAVVLVLGILAGGYFVVSKPRDPTPRPEPGQVLLSTRLEVVARGVATRVRLGAPGTLTFTMDASVGALSVSFGPPQAPVTGGEDRPDPRSTVFWTVKPGDPPHEERIYAAGLYVLRLFPSELEVEMQVDGRKTLIETAPAATFTPRGVSVEIREMANR